MTRFTPPYFAAGGSLSDTRPMSEKKSMASKLYEDMVPVLSERVKVV